MPFQQRQIVNSSGVVIDDFGGGGGGAGDASEATLTTRSSEATLEAVRVLLVAGIPLSAATLAALESITADTELPAAAALGDTDANPTTPTVGAAGMLWNATAWVRAKAATAGGAGYQLVAALGGSLASDGQTNGGGLMDPTGNVRPLAVFPYVFNGTTWDRLRGTIAGGLLALVSNLPATLGQKAMSGSLAVVLPSDQTVEVSQVKLDPADDAVRSYAPWPNAYVDASGNVYKTKRKVVTLAANATTAIVAAPGAGRKISVFGYHINYGGAAGTVTIQDSAGTPVVQDRYIAETARKDFGMTSRDPLWECTVDTILNGVSSIAALTAEVLVIYTDGETV